MSSRRDPREDLIPTGGHARSNVSTRGRSQASPPPATREPPPWFPRPELEFSEVGPELVAGTVNDFLVWAAKVPHSRVDLIRKRLASVEVTTDLHEALRSALLREPIEDPGRHLLLMATIGQLRHPDAAVPLEKFVWRAATDVDAVRNRGGCSGPAGVLEARAVEMLAYLRTNEADGMVLRAIREHPLRAVRSAAVDAFLFNHGDSEEAAAEVRRYIRQNEDQLIGMARWGKTMNVDKFEAQVAQHYRDHPDQLPPPPERVRETEPKRPSAGEPSPMGRPKSRS